MILVRPCKNLVILLFLLGLAGCMVPGSAVGQGSERDTSRAPKGKAITASSVRLGWYEPPYVPPGEDSNTYWTNDPLWRAGYLDVTKYHGNGGPVDPTGKRVSTIAIQRAIKDAHSVQGRAMNLAVFFPPGTYLIDDTLRFYNTECWSYTTTQVLIGSTKGSGRPTIRLAPSAEGFASGRDVNSAKPMIHFWNEWWGAEPCGGKRSRGNDYDDDRGFDNLYSALVRNLHLDCGQNAGCIGLRFAAAQWSSLEDVSVNAAGGFAGFRNLPTDGGYSVNLEVDGGRYGIYADHGGSGTVAGLRLSNQTTNAIYVGRGWDGVLTVAGFAITKAYAPAIRTHTSWNAGAGTLALVDGSIEVLDGRNAIDNSIGRTIALTNVFTKGSSAPIQSGGQNPVNATEGWTRVKEYSFCESRLLGFQRVDIQSMVDGIASCSEHVRVDIDPQGQPFGLISRHSWMRQPSFEDPEVCDARDYGADGMDRRPDGEALQRAIDMCPSGKVFLPKGEYILDGTLTLRSKTQFFGVSRAQTHISGGLHGWNGDRTGPSTESPMLTTDADPEGSATTWLSTMRVSPSENQIAKAKLRLGMVHWRAGGQSIVSGVMFKRYGWLDRSKSETQPHTWIRISDTGGGRWYGLSTDEADWRMDNPNFHAMKVTNTTEPLSIYNFNAESVRGNPAFLFSNVANLRVYNQKTEGVWTENWLVIEDSDNIAWYGAGASVLDDKSPGFRIINSTNIAFWNLLPRLGYDVGVVLEHHLPNDSVNRIEHNPESGRDQTGIALYKHGQPDDNLVRHGRVPDRPMPAPQATWTQTVGNWFDKLLHPNLHSHQPRQ